ncbi:MAG TPA: hypothetical protein DCP92_04310, partial [Nitrospiraceae bacterium]|nr:hypothetical protein [Nitrospiraceae bacterium]
MHYFPLTVTLIWFFFFLFAFLVAFMEIGVLGYAYQLIGINRRYLFSLLLLSLLGSYINIPVFSLPPEQLVTDRYVDFFGIRHMIPVV